MKKFTRNLYLASVLSLLNFSNAFGNGVPTAPTPEPKAAAVVHCPCCYRPDSGDPDTVRFFDSQFYGGAQVGYEHQNSKLSGTFNDGRGHTERFSWHSSPDGVIGELFLGKRFLASNCVMFGAELSAVISTNKTNKHARFEGGDRHLRFIADRRYAVMPMLVVGYVFSPRWMVYGRAGPAFAEFKTEVHDDDFQGANLKKSHRKSKWGFAPAVGVECGFSSSMSARLEIGGEIYGNVKHATSELVIPNVFQSVSTKYSANFFNAKIGVVVKI